MSDKVKSAFMAGVKAKAPPSSEPDGGEGETVCMHCGGRVGATGYAEGGEVEEEGPEEMDGPEDMAAKKRLFVEALRGAK